MKQSNIKTQCVLIAAIIVSGCGRKPVVPPIPPPTVTVSQPLRQDVTEYLELTGNTQAFETVQLRARVEGYLEKALFREGDRVKKGQILFLIQQNTYQAQLEQAQGNVAAQEARLEHAVVEFNRYSNLIKQNAAAQTDVDRWRYERNSAQAALVSAKAARDLARLDLEYTQVKAPFDGRIDRQLVDPGNLVGAGTNTILAEVNRVDPIYVYFTVNERDLLRMIAGAHLSPGELNKAQKPVFFGLANETGYPHEGKLDFSSISVTPTTGTLLLRGVFTNPDSKLLPGLFARVRLTAGVIKNAILVPQVATAFDQQGDYVLVVNEKNIVERQNVTLGIVSGENRVIITGLRGNDRVVVNGLLRAVPGKEVQPMPAKEISGK